MASHTLFPNRARELPVQEKIERDLLPALSRIRTERAIMRERWLRYYRIFDSTPDQERYHGRIQSYIPVGRRLIENWVQKVKRDLFPTDDVFGVEALRDSDRDRALAAKALLRTFFEKYTQVRRQSTPFLRQLVTYGSSPVHVTWKFDQCTLDVLENVLEDGRVTEKTVKRQRELIRYIGPTFRVVDLFAWYAWPVTVTNVLDLSLMFEDMLIERQRVLDLARTPISAKRPELGMQWENADRVLESMAKAAEAAQASSTRDAKDKFNALRRRLNDKGFTMRFEGSDPARVTDVTDVYWRTRFEDDDCVDWWRVTIAQDDVPVRVQRNPFWHGMPPWLCGKFVEVQNEFYGRGLPETFDRLQYFLNDVANQASDALVWSMNPIAVVDSYRVQDVDSIRMRPGARWLADPAGVSFTEPPKESATVGFAAVGQIIALMNDTANVAPFLGPSPAGKGRGRAASTATGAQILLSESLLQIRDVVENLEDQVYTPFLRMSHALAMQCMSKAMILKVTGIEGVSFVERRISPEDIAGDFEFRWLGSTTNVNHQVRAQQMVNFLQMVARIPPEVLQAQGIQIDLGFILRAIWEDGFSLRDGDRIIKNTNQVKAIDARIENDLFRAGRGAEVDVSPIDDDRQHIEIHRDLLFDRKLDEQARVDVAAHIQAHVAAAMAKVIMQQQAEQQQMLAAPNGSTPGVPAPANPGRPDQSTGFDELLRGLPRGGMGGT